MPKAYDTWTCHAHGPIEKLTDTLWRIEGTLPGMDLKRVMCAVKMADGRLAIHNGIALEEAAIAELEAWGTPALLIVPNGYHRLDAPAYAARYPALRVLCPSGARAKVEEVMTVHGTYADFPDDPTVSIRELAGVKGAEGVMVVRGADGVTLILNDILFNMPHGSGVAGFIFRYITASTGGPRVSRLARWLIIKQQRAVREDLEKLAEIDGLCRIIVSHHQTITDDPAGTLRRVAATL